MLQPICPTVYTVSSPLFYGSEFQAIRDRAIFLPNIKLHAQKKPKLLDEKGYDTLCEAIEKRINLDLIAGDALKFGSAMSGGVFRELIRIFRVAIDRALEAERETVELVDVEGAVAEIRGEFRRILNVEQRSTLRQIHKTCQLDDPEKVAELLQLLAVLEYANGEPWYDIHPALEKLLEEQKNEPSV